MPQASHVSTMGGTGCVASPFHVLPPWAECKHSPSLMSPPLLAYEWSLSSEQVSLLTRPSSPPPQASSLLSLVGRTVYPYCYYHYIRPNTQTFSFAASYMISLAKSPFRMLSGRWRSGMHWLAPSFKSIKKGTRCITYMSTSAANLFTHQLLAHNTSILHMFQSWNCFTQKSETLQDVWILWPANPHSQQTKFMKY